MTTNQFEHYTDNVRIVLVHTSHPGNIGAAARAMKTMNLQHLVLVCPKFYPDVDATARATGADDIFAIFIVSSMFGSVFVPSLSMSV